MSNLILHCGGKAATLDDLDTVPIPETTETYRAVPHREVAEFLKTLGGDLLTGYHLDRESYGLAREGQRMFGVQVYRDSNQDMGMAVGFRNSYDKSMSLGIALGASVFICDNLALAGDISIMKKHTPGIWEELENLAIACFYRAVKTFRTVERDAQTMQALEIDNDQAYRFLGQLYGRDVLSVRQLPVASGEWRNPTHKIFEPRTLWSLYNACTHSLKSSPPVSVMQNHANLHDMVMNEKGLWSVAAQQD